MQNEITISTEFGKSSFVFDSEHANDYLNIFLGLMVSQTFTEETVINAMREIVEEYDACYGTDSCEEEMNKDSAVHPDCVDCSVGCKR